MDYIRQLNTFLNMSAGNLPGAPFQVYMRLFQIANMKGWPESFPATDAEICMMTGIRDRRTIAEARRVLEQIGYIRVIKGGKHRATQYQIVDLVNSVENVAKNAPKNAPIHAISAKNAPINAPINAHLYKYKQETETETEKDDVIFAHAMGLPQIPAEVKSAFEGVFHPLAGLKDMERLSCLFDEFGRRGVLFVIAQAKERPQGLERIRDPFSWMRKVLLTEPSPSSRAAGAGQAAEGGERSRPPDMTHVTAEEYARRLAEADKERYERSGGDIYGIFGGSQHALKS